MNASHKTSSIKLKSQTKPVEIGITIKPKPVFDNVTELEVLATITKLTTVFNIVGKTL